VESQFCRCEVLLQNDRFNQTEYLGCVGLLPILLNTAVFNIFFATFEARNFKFGVLTPYEV